MLEELKTGWEGGLPPFAEFLLLAAELSESFGLVAKVGGRDF